MNYALVRIEPLEIIWIRNVLVNTLHWPNGDISCAPAFGDERDGYRFVSVTYTPESPGEYYDLGKEIPVLGLTELVINREWVQYDLDFVKQNLLRGVDAEAENARLQYSTYHSGQAATYHAKLVEAKEYLSNPSPSPDDYKLLSATIGIDGDTITEVANSIINAYAKWAENTAKIEAIRARAKRDIHNSTTVNAAKDIVTSISWSIG